ncbi:DUF805 domain-containing protein [Polaribacter sp. Asnod1-A03]|uniref:DUF805 domain-containing protein n=1 Tax=Polaribacter sp. Asnod1-A03 TaxID=3160581 RepID=UPI003864EC5E
MNWYLKVLKEHYADFSGRARRKEYWMFVLINALITWGLQITIFLLNIDTLFVLLLLYYLAIFIPSLSVTVRRLHDVSKSGWYILISMIPLIGQIWLLVLLCTDSENGTNKWGENPKGFGNNSAIDQIGTE